MIAGYGRDRPLEEAAVPKRSPTLAKLSQPRLSAPLLRERLFTQLDALREHPVIAVVGPPGAGKTTLVASYLGSRNVPAIWYQLDAGDADAATFFYYLRLALQDAAPGSGPALQLLTPEYLQDLAGFSRRFFRQVYACLTQPAVVVFDNFQDVPDGSPFGAIVREALAEIPNGINVLLCSRSDPPPDFARFVINERMVVLDWDELRLSLEEVREIAEARMPVGDGIVRAIHAYSDGWAAGVTLMLEQVKRTGRLDLSATAQTKDTVFRYFAGEILNRASDELRELLLRTACCGRVTVPLAEQMTGNPRAGKLLDELYSRHYFTYRRSEQELSYVYHALFREFLLDRAREIWSEHEQQAHTRRAASLLESSGEIDGAVGLYLGGGDYDSAARLIRQEAVRLLASGRWQTVTTWMRDFPSEYLERAPWLLYWWGTALIPVNQSEARRLLERAATLMATQGDRVGGLLAAVGVIETHFFEWSTFRPMDHWIDAITEGLQAAPEFPSPDVELGVYSALVMAMSCRRPGDPKLPHFVARAISLLGSDADVNRKATAGTFLLGYSYFASDHALAKRVIGMVEPLAGAQALSPLNQLWWRARFAYYSWHLGEYTQALKSIAEANAIAGRHGLEGLHSAQPLVSWYTALIAVSRGDMNAAREQERSLERLLKPDRRMDLWYLSEAQTCLALCARDTRLTLDLAQATLDIATQTGMIYIEGLALLLLGHAFVQLARFDDALRTTARAREMMEHTVLRHLTCECFLIDAYVAAQQGDEMRCSELLDNGLRRAQETDYVFWYRWVPGVLPALCAKALALGLHAQFVLELIHRLQLPPPEAPSPHWPWPLKLSTFGRVALWRGSTKLELPKRARKPMELLKAIIVCGGRDVDLLSVAEMLWPDADGDAGQKAFDITLHRLRKQLSDDRALNLRRGTVSIEPSVLWVDVTAFESLVERIESLDLDNRSCDPAVLGVVADALVELYQGRFLPTDLDLAWAIPLRDRLHARFLRALMHVGKGWESVADYQRAILVYRHGLQVDQAAEMLYQRLMLCYYKCGRLAEVAEAYDHCQVALSGLTGRPPSPETEALRQSLLSDSSRIREL